MVRASVLSMIERAATRMIHRLPELTPFASATKVWRRPSFLYSPPAGLAGKVN
jgi:hypothetical protein